MWVFPVAAEWLMDSNNDDQTWGFSKTSFSLMYVCLGVLYVWCVFRHCLFYKLVAFKEKNDPALKKY